MRAFAVLFALALPGAAGARGLAAPRGASDHPQCSSTFDCSPGKTCVDEKTSPQAAYHRCYYVYEAGSKHACDANFVCGGGARCVPLGRAPLCKYDDGHACESNEQCLSAVCLFQNRVGKCTRRGAQRAKKR